MKRKLPQKRMNILPSKNLMNAINVLNKNKFVSKCRV